MQNNKDSVYSYLQEQTTKGTNQATTILIAEALGMQRTNVSAILNQLVSEGKITKTKTRPVYYHVTNKENDDDCFNKMVGSNGSLNSAVQLAKAAVLYPSHSLNCLIVGNRGTGKSYLASLMFEFAKSVGVIKKDAGFIKINCRHFTNDQEGLSNLLFGKNTLKNVFDLAEGSFLFIDNIDLLDGVSLTRILNFIETGNYYYDNDNKLIKKNVTLLIAIDNNPSDSTFQTLNSKISVKINLPDYSKKSYNEKLELITCFFKDEAKNTNHSIQTTSEVVRTLLVTDTPLNTKYIFGCIKTAVANAYLRTYDSNSETINVILDDFDETVKESLLKARGVRNEIAEAIPTEYSYFYTADQEENNEVKAGNDFYDYLNQKIKELKKRGLDKKSINAVLNADFERMTAELRQNIETSEINNEQLSKVVDPKIIQMVTKFIENASITLQRKFSSSVVYGLCLHINAIDKHQRETKYLSSETVNEMIQKHAEEYALMADFADKIEKKLGCELSIDEVVLLTMFIVKDTQKENRYHPQLLIAMHGDGIASSIVEVVNTLVKANNSYAYDMSLNKDSDTAYQELKEKVIAINQGEGIIVIYDMGSLKTMLEKISEETGVEIRMIYVPITLIGIDASRKLSMNDDLDSTYHSILSALSENISPENKLPALITLCHTGKGGATQVKNYIRDHYKKNIKIYDLAVSDKKELVKQVKEIRKGYDIRAFIGTYDPELFGIPFIPVSKIFEDKKDDFDLLIMRNLNEGKVNFDQMLEYLSQEADLDIDKLKACIPSTVSKLDELYGLNFDQKVGLFMHIGAVIKRIEKGEKLIGNRNYSKYLTSNKEDMKKIRETMKKVEKTFSVIVPDAEIATIFEIVKKEEK